MSFKSQAMIFAAGFVLCLAIVLPLVFRSNEPVADISTKQESIRPGSPPVPPQSSTGSRSDLRSKTSSKKSLATTLAPLYTIGIFLYLIYIVHRILSRKKNDVPSRAAELKKKRKTRISGLPASEFEQLEQKVAASEKAVEEILQRAHIAMAEAYQNVSSDSSLSDSSDTDDNEAKVMELSEGTTSSANNDSHQDSSSSMSEKVAMHRRKTRHRKKQSFSSDSSSASSTSVIEQLYRGKEFMVAESGSSSLDEEDASPSQLEFSSENGHKSDNASKVLRESSSAITLSLADHVNKSVEDVGRVEHGETPTGDTEALDSVKKKNRKSEKQAENQRLLDDQEKLRQTTSEVLTAMKEIKTFIRCQKE